MRGKTQAGPSLADVSDATKQRFTQQIEERQKKLIERKEKEVDVRPDGPSSDCLLFEWIID